MANKWLTADEMDALLPATYSGQVKRLDGTFADVTFERVGTYIRDLGGNNTNMVVTWFNADTPSDQHGRYITRYNASISGITLPSDPLDRIIKVTMPLYTSNVKYLEVPVLGWIDLGAAASLSYDASLDGSFEAYNRNGVQSQIYSLPSTDGTKIGTTRISNNEGVSVYRNLFEIDEELGDQPISVDFLEMQYMCCYSESGVISFWISQICINDDATFPDTPVPPSQGGEWGDPTQRAGGQGTHTASSDSRGDRAGTTVRDIMSDRNDALALAFDTPFMRTYTFDNLTSAQIAEIFAILYGTDYWSMYQNQMLNPLSSIVAFHLIPSTLRGSNLTLEDLVIGPKNISAAMTGTPQVTKIKQVKWYHIGSVDMTDVLLPYFDAYPDFAPYTDIILHLPYIGDIKIDVNAVMYGALSVEYACDNVSGNVAAWIYCEDRYPSPQTHKQYKYIATGNCAYSIPLFAQSQNGLDVGKIIGSGIGIVGGAAAGNLAAAVSGAVSLGSALYEHSRAPISTQSTGGSSGNVSILGDTDVWIEVIRPQWIQPESYQQLVGIPSGISGTLSDINASGRVVCSDIETDGITATEPELREIERLLMSGIYLKRQR